MGKREREKEVDIGEGTAGAGRRVENEYRILEGRNEEADDLSAR